MPYLTHLKKVVSLALVASLLSTSQIGNSETLDMRDYYVGEYDVDGFNTTEIESYHAKVNIEVNTGHFLKVEIQHDAESGLGTYYGFFSEVDKNTLRLDYKNLGGYEFTAMCDVKNSFDNFPKIICEGDLQGTIGYDGVFVIHKVW